MLQFSEVSKRVGGSLTRIFKVDPKNGSIVKCVPIELCPALVTVRAELQAYSISYHKTPTSHLRYSSAEGVPLAFTLFPHSQTNLFPHRVIRNFVQSCGRN